jgi:GrpB-like predicted nucleotidyltransferase (UPF0157 family)
MARVQFVESDVYRARNEATFEDLEQRLRHIVPGARVEHVGASALPGALSKGDLDVFVGVPPVDHAPSVALIETLGFRVKPHTLRTPALCMLETDQFGYDVAIQVVANDSRFEFFLTFRDRVRADPALLHAYNAIKRSHDGGDVEAYRAEKSAFIQRVLR